MKTTTIKPSTNARSKNDEQAKAGEPSRFNTQPRSSAQKRWTQLVSQTYFPLTLHYGDHDEDIFQGSLKVWKAEGSGYSLSRLCSDRAEYSRSRSQISEDNHSSFLVTIPLRTSVFFSQHGKSLSCPPGHFIVEQGDAPYRFGYKTPNDMWVFKIPCGSMKTRIRRPERYSQHCFSAQKGIGCAFVEFLMICSQHVDECSVEEQNRLFEQALGMLSMVLEQDERVLNSDQSHLKTAHLVRIERYISVNLGDPDLTPARIAHFCGISLRYLHKLFSGSGYTVSEWVRLQRLEAAHRELESIPEGIHIGEIAYRWGFSNQAQFCRMFRQQFGYSASELRNSSSRQSKFNRQNAHPAMQHKAMFIPA
ncbi:AraC family transcriptional regulator [Pistricoccus aurantiacus]|uniref:AraC family transcriptional regulator n=1 Tax=Pistricoccus aurantiacus TaxID=1883414 RepID=A0A5B8SUW3_9GAMM|nr:AraC family transcriptional regulator [Pistricoccus aurantiacus]QEA40141.1 AraC family transcriptional regulator [Pistricoccus aurantiacus]